MTATLFIPQPSNIPSTNAYERITTAWVTTINKEIFSSWEHLECIRQSFFLWSPFTNYYLTCATPRFCLTSNLTQIVQRILILTFVTWQIVMLCQVADYADLNCDQKAWWIQITTQLSGSRSQNTVTMTNLFRDIAIVKLYYMHIQFNW